MTNIENMIQTLCPNGVEFKKLKEVTSSIKTGLNPRTNFVLNADGATHYYVTVKEITTGRIVFSDKTDRITEEARARIQERSLLEEDDILFSGIGTIGKVAIVDIPTYNWNCSESVYLIKPIKSIILPKYLMYFLGSAHSKEQYESLSVGSTLKGVRKNVLEAIDIPVPPMQIQKYIADFLDCFYTLAAELQAELQMRHKQYEYYRTHLLMPHSGSNSADNSDDCNWVWTTLGEIGTFTRGRRFVRTDIVDEGQPCIHYGDMYTYYGLATDHARTHLPKDFPVKLRYAEKGDIIIVGAGENDMDIGVGCVWEGDEPVAVHDACYIFKHKQYPRFISHYLRSLDYHLQIKKNVSTAKICAISPEGIAKAKIALPPLAEQKRIADFLDTFEVLLTSLSDGIPAEQALQQKRYEYYRDLLLTFPRKEV